MTKGRKPVRTLAAIIPVVVLIGYLAVATDLFGSDSLSGGSQGASTVATGIFMNTATGDQFSSIVLTANN